MATRITGTRNITPQDQNEVSLAGGNVSIITSSTGQLLIKGVDGAGNTISNIPRQLELSSDSNVQNPTGIPYDPADVFGGDGVFGSTATNLANNQRQQGSAYFPGGVGIQKDLNVGGYIYGRVSLANTSTELLITATNINSNFYITFTDNITAPSGKILLGDNVGAQGGLVYNPGLGRLTSDKVTVASTDVDPSITGNNALVVRGGTVLQDDVIVGNLDTVTPADLSIYGNILPLADDFKLADGTTSWLEGWMENIYAKNNLKLAPEGGLTEIIGNIRVRDGDRPIGTAPVVTNILYVTMDGNDTNDGRAQDASRACRTIGGAKQPLLSSRNSN